MRAVMSMLLLLFVSSLATLLFSWSARSLVLLHMLLLLELGIFAFALNIR